VAGAALSVVSIFGIKFLTTEVVRLLLWHAQESKSLMTELSLSKGCTPLNHAESPLLSRRQETQLATTEPACELFIYYYSLLYRQQ
jgi:hypothetical protein